MDFLTLLCYNKSSDTEKGESDGENFHKRALCAAANA